MTPLFWSNVALPGKFDLDTSMDLGRATA